MQRLSTEHRGVFQKLFDEIKHLCKLATAGTKEARELEKVKKIFEDAYRTETKNPTADGGVKYSIVALDNGNVYVKASRNVITGKTRADQRKNITDFFNDLLDGNPSLDIQTIEGDILTITKADTADKARDDYKTVQGKPVKMTDAEFLVKLRAEAHIDELAEISHKNNRPPVPDGKNHTFAKNGFTYRRAYFEDFDGQYYEITLSIGHNGTVATVYNVGKISKGVLPSAKIIAVVGSKALGKTPSTFSLSTTIENVKENISLNGTKDTVPAGGYRITGEDIALAPTREDIAEQGKERIATAQNAPRNDVEELGAPTREDIANQERDKKLKGPLMMKDSLDRELEKLYRLQQTGQIQDDAYFLELFKVNAAYQEAGRNFNEAFSRVYGAYQGEVETQTTVAGEDSTAVNTDPAQHTPQEQAIIEEYQAAVDEDIREVFEEHLNNPNGEFSRHTIGDVSERQARDAARLLGGEYTGYKNAINTNGVKHILNEHGPNGTVDVSMADLNDPARIGYVLDNYDSVKIATYKSGDPDTSAEFRTKDNRPAPMLIYKKKVNGTYYVVEAVPESKFKKFWVISAYMEADSGTQAPDAQNPGNTPNASLASSLSANNSMPQSSDGVKQKEVEAVLGEKGVYVSKQANALYDEVKSMQKGKRVSNTLSYLLDTLDLSEELGAPTREDIARMEAEKELHGPWRMEDPLDQKVEKTLPDDATGKKNRVCFQNIPCLRY